MSYVCIEPVYQIFAMNAAPMNRRLDDTGSLLIRLFWKFSLQLLKELTKIHIIKRLPSQSLSKRTIRKEGWRAFNSQQEKNASGIIINFVSKDNSQQGDFK